MKSLNASEARDELLHQMSCYDQRAVRSQLNLLGSHDTERILTILGGDHGGVALATLLQMTLPGAPCVYYGDEIGLAGGKDPDCRRAFPWDESAWHHPTRELVRSAIALRRARRSLRHGSFLPVHAEQKSLAFLRQDESERLLVVINAGARGHRLRIAADALGEGRAPAMAGELLSTGEASTLDVDAQGTLSVRVPARSGFVAELRE